LKRLLDAKVLVVGVAGIFVALGLAAAGLLGFGHITTALGQALNLGPMAQAGDSLSAVGLDLIVFLAALGIVVVLAFVYFIRR
jgi:hypothetical protein